MISARHIRLALVGSVVGVGVALALTACGSSGGTAAPAQATPTTAQETTAPPTVAASTAAESDAEGSGAVLTNLSSALSAASSLVNESKNDSTAAATGTEADCPLTAADISAVTALNWQFEQYQAARPLESDKTVMTTVCAFTAPEVVDEYGDPAFLRTDAFEGADAAKHQADYVSGCPESGGVLTPLGTPTAVGCARGGVVIDAQVGDGTRLVEVWINASKDKQAQLANAWDPLLAAVN
ncbi:MAG: hypothetical protein ABJD68_14240 [Nakamurella sp.]